MTKTQVELNQLKNEYKTLNNKLKELTKDELKEVCGGTNEYDEQMLKCVNHGKNGKPTLPLWDEVSPGLIADPVVEGSSPEEHNIIITGDFTDNLTNGAGGGVTNEGKF